MSGVARERLHHPGRTIYVRPGECFYRRKDNASRRQCQIFLSFAGAVARLMPWDRPDFIDLRKAGYRLSICPMDSGIVASPII